MKKKSQNTSFSNPIGSNRFEGGDFIQLAWHVPAGPTSPRQSVAVWALSTTPNETINREPQRVATGATAAPTDTDHSTVYPGGGSKTIMAVASTIFPPAQSAKRDEIQAIDPKHRGTAQDFDSCIAVAVPCVAFKGFVRPLKRS